MPRPRSSRWVLPRSPSRRSQSSSSSGDRKCRPSARFTRARSSTPGGIPPWRGRAAWKAGAWRGRREGVELGVGDGKRYGGKGVRRAVTNVIEVIAPELDGMEATEQAVVDRALLELDGTPNKSALGANALLGVSLAVARAAADESGLSLYQYLGGAGARLLPVPLMNILNGGVHADNGLDIQEFMLVPAGAHPECLGEVLGAGGGQERKSTRL